MKIILGRARYVTALDLFRANCLYQTGSSLAMLQLPVEDAKLLARTFL